MAWLVRDGEVLASLEVATGRRARRRGLLGLDSFEGVLQIRARSVHTFGMRFSIDIAMCDPSGEVLRVRTMKPWRVSRPLVRACLIYEAQAGTFRAMGVAPGDLLEVR